MRILVINGPNLNMLGKREVAVYGRSSLGDIESMVMEKASELGVDVLFYQSNHEGEIIDRIQVAKDEGVDAMVMNPGGYTHSSVAIRDAILAVDIPFVEVHITNVASREAFRKNSMFSDIALGTISGLGPFGYVLALEALVDRYGR